MHKNVLVTGGTRGIGAAIAIDLKSKGYSVFANYHSNHVKAKEFMADYDIPVINFDVANFDSCQEALQSLENDYGAIDILIHNAGITKDRFLHKMTVNEWEEVVSTNLNSCFYVTRPLLEGMRQRQYGRLVYISSVNAFKGQIGQTNYSAAKAGMVAFVKSLSLESATKGITVNAIAPGYTETTMIANMQDQILKEILSTIPSQRFARPSEIAAAVAFLISEAATYINGTTIHVNGGTFG